jgi:hypothetical protein
MKCNIQRMYRIHAGLDEAITLAVLAKAVDEATSGLRSMAEKLTRQRDEAALIAWIPITPNIRIKDRDVLLTCGAGWYVRIGRWRDSHRQKLSAFMTTAGWWSREAAGYAYIPNQPNFYAEIPAAPSGPTGE